jgi:hypothetical protein
VLLGPVEAAGVVGKVILGVTADVGVVEVVEVVEVVGVHRSWDRIEHPGVRVFGN